MLVEEGEGGGSLADADELVRALQDILGFLMRRRRHAGQSVSSTVRPGGDNICQRYVGKGKPKVGDRLWLVDFVGKSGGALPE